MKASARWTLIAYTLLVGCGDDKPASSCSGATGGPLSGAADSHCMGMVQTVDQTACHPPDAGAPPDASALDAGATTGNGFGDTMNNVEGDDDDCKYHVKWTSTSVCQNASVYFTVTATVKATGRPLTGAITSMSAEDVTLGTTHAAPNSGFTGAETPPGSGIYKVGPVKFDRAGQWTVRFHFYETCTDSAASPHGHAAFFVNVP
jgi:hypothetical protein